MYTISPHITRTGLWIEVVANHAAGRKLFCTYVLLGSGIQYVRDVVGHVAGSAALEAASFVDHDMEYAGHM